MKDFIVYFELYGKKMKATVKAFNEDGAKLIIKDKIIFHKVEEVKKQSKDDFINDLMNAAKDIFK